MARRGAVHPFAPYHPCEKVSRNAAADADWLAGGARDAAENADLRHFIQPWIPE
jgi:hypothetical protein